MMGRCGHLQIASTHLRCTCCDAKLGEFNLLSWMHIICEPKGYHYIIIVNSSAKVRCKLQSAWVWWERFGLQMLCKVGRIQSANQMCITTSSIQLHLQSCATAIIGMGVMRRIWFNWTMRFAGCMHPPSLNLLRKVGRSECNLQTKWVSFTKSSIQYYLTPHRTRIQVTAGYMWGINGSLSSM